METRSLVAWGLGALGLGGLAYLVLRGGRPISSQTSRLLGGTPGEGATSLFARMQAEPEVRVMPAGTNWSFEPLSKESNMLSETGVRYMARVSRSGLASITVEGTLVEALGNTKPQMMKITRIVEAKPGVLQSHVEIPTLPMTLTVPSGGTNVNFHRFLQPTRWEDVHPTSASETALEKVPPVGARVRYVMREANDLGRAVLVITGRVLSVDPDEGEVTVSADDISRVVRGDKNIPLPGKFTISDENLIAPLAT